MSDGLGPILGANARSVILRQQQTRAAAYLIMETTAPVLRWKTNGIWESVWVVGTLENPEGILAVGDDGIVTYTGP